jgi:hypothetical protein
MSEMSQSSTKKILIMGVGGCGSGYLIRTLENCGLDTGGYNSYLQHGPVRGLIASGLDPKDIEMPRVIKHLGGFMTGLNAHIDRHGWEIEHIFLAVTPYEFQIEAYQRRRGIDREESERRYVDSLSAGMFQLIERDHPFTVIRCPESILAPKYMYDKVKLVLPDDFTFDTFKAAHREVRSEKHFKRLKNRLARIEYDPLH